MIDLTGRIVSISRNFWSRKPEITLEVNEDIAEFEELGKAELRIRLWRKKVLRSLDSNGYFYLLVNKLAIKLGESDQDLHDKYLRENLAFILNDEGAVDWRVTAWKSNKYGLYHDGGEWFLDTYTTIPISCELVGMESEGKVFWHIKGSHQMDSQEMSRLIDCVIRDCQEQGITTATPDEIARMEALWERRQTNK